jgi:hypothetical protein
VAARRKRPAKAGAGRGGDQHGGGGGSKRHPHQKGKAWVLKKKDQMRSKGVEVSTPPQPLLVTSLTHPFCAGAG